MTRRSDQCQFCDNNLNLSSSSLRFLTFRKFLFLVKTHFIERKNIIDLVDAEGQLMFGKRFRFLGSYAKKRKCKKDETILKLGPSEMVEVLTEKEIISSLDSEGKLRGLIFMPEMKKYCGHRFRVYKRLERIAIETTGDMRNIKNTVLLDGVFCDGSSHLGCDRSCYCFWRETWLKRVSEKNH